MSFNVQSLKSASDENIPSFLRAVEVGTTANLFHNTLLEFGLIGKGARIVNNDSVNSLGFKLHSNHLNQAIQVIPVNSEFLINEWFSEIFLLPDGTTGDFQLTLELATIEEARKRSMKR